LLDNVDGLFQQNRPKSAATMGSRNDALQRLRPPVTLIHKGREENLRQQDCSIAGIIAFELIVVAPPALAQSTINIQYTEIQDQVRPKTIVVYNTRTVQVTLGENNKLSERFRSTGGAVADSTVGPNEPTACCGSGNARWRVSGPNALLREANYPQHIQRLTVKVEGKSCTVSISYALKPGFHEYRLTNQRSGQPEYLKSLRTDNISCRIS
jgi:hypothetical protein